MQNTRIYELTIVFKLNFMNAQIVKSIMDMQNQDIIAEIINIEYLGLRSIPLRNRKTERAHFTCIYYRNTSAQQSLLIEKLRIREDILRFVAFRRKDVRNAPSHLYKSDYPMYKYNYSEDTNSQEIYYHNIEYLRKFTTERGRILPAKVNHLSAKEQRNVANAIKRARACGFISYMNE